MSSDEDEEGERENERDTSDLPPLSAAFEAFLRESGVAPEAYLRGSAVRYIRVNPRRELSPHDIASGLILPVPPREVGVFVPLHDMGTRSCRRLLGSPAPGCTKCP